MGAFKFDKNIGLGITLVIVLFNVILDRYYAPAGITLTPVVIVAIATLVSLNKDKYSPFLHVAIVYLLIALNDIGIKLYGGGIHDWEGLGWIHMMLFIGLLPCFILLAIGIKATNFIDRLPLLLFIALIIFHLTAFGKLGLGRFYI
ncbi:hypothetical protein NAF17_15850 [Mucilaginibacter sp. RB4R14]|uniref:hypothetical protein n=1 Tax=Mucilaginibacter aurantiaciroseus TaxID=2949308 RepID=UPI002091C4DF|nr:hypothetical protein [Mucilaginibacter aurantiaciroseus]MCO5937018.1 hypothetical protein [Mucilaginibacter aurantiaciroseus]